MERYSIRTYGDPVLKQVSKPVTEIDGALADVCNAMLDVMYEAPGIGLAAPQVGIRQRFFVYDHGEGPSVLINPVIAEGDGEFEFDEGCLSIPGLSFMIVRPKLIHVTGYDIDGNEVSIEADEIEARLFQHELDHLDGVLLLEHLDDDQRKEAMRELRQRAEASPSGAAPAPAEGGLRLP